MSCQYVYKKVKNEVILFVKSILALLDLLLTLDKFLLTLTQCQSALLHYMEGRRVRCPWLYFLPLEDVLQLVCYSKYLQ